MAKFKAIDNSKKVLITGAAGFIGFHLAKKLLGLGATVLGFDNMHAYYDVGLKESRLQILRQLPGFTFVRGDLADAAAVEQVFAEFKPQLVVNLAAQAGVRYSIDNPRAYIDSNVIGFFNVLECCRHHPVEHLLFASSSSVYGNQAKTPFATTDNVDHPISLYAATKKANEVMAHTYAHLYRIPVTGLRFFTVYGPWGRPDMALFKFTRAMLAGEAIDVYGEGRLVRDFTYIDDIVEGVLRVLDKPATPDPAYDPAAPNPSTSSAPYRIFNIGNSAPTVLMDYITALESALGTTARKNMLPIQPGDMHSTAADTSALAAWVGFAPSTPVQTGVARFVNWYRGFYEGQ